jgi:hypothetical protein
MGLVVVNCSGISFRTWASLTHALRNNVDITELELGSNGHCLAYRCGFYNATWSSKHVEDMKETWSFLDCNALC